MSSTKSAGKLVSFDMARFLAMDAVAADSMPAVFETDDPDRLLLALGSTALGPSGSGQRRGRYGVGLLRVIRFLFIDTDRG